MTNKSLVIFGVSTGEEVLSTARMINGGEFDSINLIAFDKSIDRNETLKTLKELRHTIYYNIAIADTNLKREAHHFAEAEGMRAYSVIHPTAVIDPTAKVKPGVFVGPLAVISAMAEVGGHSIIHIHSSIGHHAKVGEYSAILPGARISGHAQIGTGVLVGSNAFVFQGVTLGDGSKVDALTYVKDDIPANKIASCRSPRDII